MKKHIFISVRTAILAIVSLVATSTLSNTPLYIPGPWKKSDAKAVATAVAHLAKNGYDCSDLNAPKMPTKTAALVKALEEARQSRETLKPNSNFDPQSLIILLDDSEYRLQNSFHTLTCTFVYSLLQDAAPIAVSTSLAHNVFTSPCSNIQGGPTAIFDAYYSAQGGAKINSIVRQVLNFEENDWVIKKVSDNLCLFFPINYLKKKLTQEEISSLRSGNIQEGSLVEYKLGLKIGEMQTITTTDLVKKKTLSESLKQFFSKKANPDDYFLDTLKNRKLILSSSDYDLACKKKIITKESARPLWSFYIMGHGGSGTLVVGMATNTFKNVLKLLDEEISTRLVVYNSCDGTGRNGNLIFKNEGQEKTYSYAIISAGNFDASSNAIIFVPDRKELSEFLLFKKHDNMLLDQADFDTEFNKLTTNFSISKRTSGMPYLTLLETMTFEIKDDRLALRDRAHFGALITAMNSDSLDYSKIGTLVEDDCFNRLSQVKSPFAKGFTPTLPAICVSNLHDNHVQSDLTNTANKVLLYATEIDEVIVDQPKVHQVISVIPGDAHHTIKKFSSNVHNDEKMLAWFWLTQKDTPHKSFYIQELGKAKNVIIQTPCGEDAPIYNEPLAFYTDQHGEKKVKWDFEFKKERPVNLLERTYYCWALPKNSPDKKSDFIELVKHYALTAAMLIAHPRC